MRVHSSELEGTDPENDAFGLISQPSSILVFQRIHIWLKCWSDCHKGYRWGAFANYDKVQNGMTEVYGLTLKIST